ncbi:hypothetical protein DNTS_011122 [Danionella cerebrum]|uniref:Uncharacterized protein n=1 Tax=Danionella cerebrum TaxID=2873325 RepID=A0A553MME4_9TELE|nr:hypothetical protein DNTS_011122 [Danionella translucida]
MSEVSTRLILYHAIILSDADRGPQKPTQACGGSWLLLDPRDTICMTEVRPAATCPEWEPSLGITTL